MPAYCLFELFMQWAEIALSLVIIFYFCNEIPSPPTKGAFITQYIWGQRSVLCRASSIHSTAQSPHAGMGWGHWLIPSQGNWHCCALGRAASTAMCWGKDGADAFLGLTWKQRPDKVKEYKRIYLYINFIYIYNLYIFIYYIFFYILYIYIIFYFYIFYMFVYLYIYIL